MKRKNNNNNRKKNNNNNVLIKKNINLNSNIVSIDVISTTVLYYYNATPNVSFSTGADVRYYAFATVIAGTYPFVDFSTVYSDYRINSAAVVCTPYSNVTVVTPPLHVTCDPDGAGGNPTNSTLIASPNAHDFNLSQLGPKNAQFTFPGVDRNTRIWTDTSVSPTGSFYVGMNQTNLTGPATALLYEMSFILNISFRNIKGN